MSRFVVHAGERVKKGEVIGYVGSTGRSTGNHLHSEVRIEGSPANPLPFVRSAQLAVAALSGDQARMAMGGPEEQDSFKGSARRGGLRRTTQEPLSVATP